MSSLLLKNGNVINLKGVRGVDVLIREGKIVQLKKGIPSHGIDRVIDCSRKYILPGLIDVHAHLREPGLTHKEDLETGTRAAAAGGITTVFDMPNTEPAVTTRKILAAKQALYEEKRQQGKISANVFFLMGATVDSSTGRTNVEEFLESNAIAYKVYLAQSTGNLLVDNHEALVEIFSKVGKAKSGPQGVDRVICVHAEDQAMVKKGQTKPGTQNNNLEAHAAIRNTTAAVKAVKVVLKLAKKYRARLHICHVSSKAELKEIQKVKTKRITCEVTPHHLTFNDFSWNKFVAARDEGLLKVNPPIRTDSDRWELWQGLKNGVIDMVASDHAPHTWEEKHLPFAQVPAGVPGLETLLPVVMAGDGSPGGSLNWAQVVKITNDAPARVFGLTSKQGMVEGNDADIVVVGSPSNTNDPLWKTVKNGKTGAQYTKCQWSPFVGMRFAHWPVLTIVHGQVVWESLS